MGANHVSVVYAQWGRILDGRPFRLLVHMALTAKDSDNPPMYWAGRDGMAEALGREDDPAGHQAVKRALAVLKREGAVKVDRKPRKARHATRWIVVLTPPQGVTNRTPIVPDTGDGSGSQTVPQSGTKSDPIGGHKTTDWGTETDPQRTTRTMRSEPEEEISSSQVSTDRACEPNDEPGINLFDAKRIVREFMDAGGQLPDLLADAPDGLNRAERDLYCARQIIAKEAS